MSRHSNASGKPVNLHCRQSLKGLHLKTKRGVYHSKNNVWKFAQIN